MATPSGVVKETWFEFEQVIVPESDSLALDQSAGVQVSRALGSQAPAAH